MKVTVVSPGVGDYSGVGGVGFIVDVALDANNARGNLLLSASAGYKPFFNAPVTSAGLPDPHTGSDPGAPGLVVLLSSTPSKPGTPFMGPRTNLAGLFQINGVAKVRRFVETWNTWQPQKPIFGLNQHAQLTVYVVAGTAPTLVPTHGLKVISNIVKVPFTIRGEDKRRQLEAMLHENDAMLMKTTRALSFMRDAPRSMAALAQQIREIDVEIGKIEGIFPDKNDPSAAKREAFEKLMSMEINVTVQAPEAPPPPEDFLPAGPWSA